MLLPLLSTPSEATLILSGWFVIHVCHAYSPQKRLPPDPAAKAGAGCQDSQGRGRLNRSCRVSFIAISQAADQTSWRLSAMARIVWQQLVAHTLHRPSGCRVSLRASQPRHSSRCRIRLVVMRIPITPIKKRNAEPSLSAPATSAKRHIRTAPLAGAPFWNAVSGAASDV